MKNRNVYVLIIIGIIAYLYFYKKTSVAVKISYADTPYYDPLDPFKIDAPTYDPSLPGPTFYSPGLGYMDDLWRI